MIKTDIAPDQTTEAKARSAVMIPVVGILTCSQAMVFTCYISS